MLIFNHHLPKTPQDLHIFLITYKKNHFFLYFRFYFQNENICSQLKIHFFLMFSILFSHAMEILAYIERKKRKIKTTRSLEVMFKEVIRMS